MSAHSRVWIRPRSKPRSCKIIRRASGSSPSPPGASATPNPVTGTTTALSVLASDTSGESHVTYTWSATVSPLGSSPVFSINGNNAAKNTTVTFDRAGAYTFTVVASDGIFVAPSIVVVTVEQTLTAITVSPSTASLNPNGAQLFTASGTDQFGQTTLIPPIATWSVDSGGVGSVNSLLGLYTAGATPASRPFAPPMALSAARLPSRLLIRRLLSPSGPWPSRIP